MFHARFGYDVEFDYFWLVVWNFGTFGLFAIVYGTILPIDKLIFFKIVKTTNQIYIILTYINQRDMVVDVHQPEKS